VVALIDGVTNVLPVPKDDPPEATSNQFNIPALAVAFKVNVPVSHRLAGVEETMVGMMLIVAVTDVLGEGQFPLTAST
jgi:hypothetical protein